MVVIVSALFFFFTAWAVQVAFGWTVMVCYIAAQIVFTIIRCWDELAEQIEEWKNEID